MVELGLSPEYVLDHMEVYEIQPLLDKAYLKHRDEWEQTRLICGYLHKAWFKGEPKMGFPWDPNKKSEQKVTREQADALLAQMALEEEKMKNGKC